MSLLGMDAVAESTMHHLSAWVGPKVLELDTTFGPPRGGAVPEPALYHPSQLAMSDVKRSDWPFVLVIGGNDAAPTEYNRDPSAGDELRRVHLLNLYLWCAYDDFETTTGAVHRLAGATQEVLIQRQAITVVDAAGTPVPGVEKLRVDPTTLRAGYSDVVVDKTLSATIGAARIQLSVTSFSTIASFLPVAGTVLTPPQLDTPRMP